MIKKIADDCWEVRVHVGDRYRRKRCRLLAEAKRLERELLHDLHNPSLTFAEAVEAWATDAATKARYSEGVLARRLSSLEALCREGLADIPVKDITAEKIRPILERRKELKPATLEFHRTIIASVMAYAGTPVKWPRLPVARKMELAIWSREEFETFIRHVKKQNKDWYFIFAFAALTGMRAGELIALRWENIGPSTISVVESYDAKYKLNKASTKNFQVRKVPINKQLAGLLKSIGKGNAPYVLPRLGMFVGGYAASVLRQYAVIAGVRPVRFHDLRAFYACQLALNGIAIHIIRSICGWGDLKVVNRYLRVSGAEIEGATDSLNLPI